MCQTQQQLWVSECGVAAGTSSGILEEKGCWRDIPSETLDRVKAKKIANNL